MGLKRGDIVTVALPGDLGKPRPAVVIETDYLAPTDFVVVCPGTSHVLDDVEPRRILVEPGDTNQLKLPTQFQADKVTAVRRSNCDQHLGRLNGDAMENLNRALFTVLGLADPS